jgi:hypothetical protein
MTANLDLMERLGTIMARTADLNRWVLRVCEKGCVTEDMRRDMVSAAEQIINATALLEARK